MITGNIAPINADQLATAIGQLAATLNGKAAQPRVRYTAVSTTLLATDGTLVLMPLQSPQGSGIAAPQIYLTFPKAADLPGQIYQIVQEGMTLYSVLATGTDRVDALTQSQVNLYQSDGVSRWINLTPYVAPVTGGGGGSGSTSVALTMLLDFTLGANISFASGGGWMNLGPAQTIMVGSSGPVFIQASGNCVVAPSNRINPSFGKVAAALLIDGSVQRVISGGYLPGGDFDTVNAFDGSGVEVFNLSAGSHSVQVQVYCNQSFTASCQPQSDSTQQMKLRAWQAGGSTQGLASSGGGERGCLMTLCAGFTPAATGADVAEFVVPYDPKDGSTSVTWNIRRIDFRVQTAGGAPSVTVEKSTASGAFSAGTVGTVTLASGANEGSTTISLGTVASGNKLRINVGTLATAQNWTVEVLLGQ